MINIKTYLSAHWVDGKSKDVTSDNMSAALKFVATAIYYPYLEHIPVDRVDILLLGSGGANSLSFSGYRNRGIKKLVDG